MANLKPTKKIIPYALGLLVGLVLAAAVLIVGVYRLDWYNPTVKTLLRALPLPVATVGWKPLPLSEYRELKNTIEKYRAVWSRSTDNAVAADFNAGQVALNKMIRDQATMVLLSQRRIVLTDTDVDQAFSAQIAQGGSRQDTIETIKEIYGWTADQFKDQILKVAVAREKLREALSFDQAANASQQQQAERVYDLALAGDQTFSELATVYSEDQYAANGGDMGFIASGGQLTEIDNAAFSLAVGQTSELIHTKYGWHILLVEAERITDDIREIQLRQIFIAAPSVDLAINEFLKSHRVGVYVRGYRWNDEESVVEPE